MSRPDASATPVDLRTEYATDPVGIDVRAPRLSWAIDAERRGAAQSAYRILVASSREALLDDRGDLWDSGKVASDRSLHVEYEGADLGSGERAFWKVRVWDEADEPSPWSDPTHWEMGLLDGDWRADWIGSPDGSDREVIAEHERQWTDYAVEVECSIDRGPFGVLFRAEDSYNAYLAELDVDDAGELAFSLKLREHGRWRTLDDVVCSDAAPPAELRLRVEVRENEIATFVDGEEIHATTDETHETGRVGLYAPEGASASVSEIVATDHDGTTLYADDFETPARTADNYSGGQIEDGALEVADSGVVLLHVFRPHVAPGPLFRTEVDLDAAVETARAYVCGLGFYELEINGSRIGEHVLDPGRTNYDGTVLYATHDVTDALRSGDNAIGVALGRARYGAPPPTIVNWHRAPWWSDPTLLLQIEVTLADGTTRTITSGDDWRTTDGPTRFDSLLYGEVHDARRDPTAWTTPGFDDSAWDEARIRSGPDGDLVAQQVRPIEPTDELTPVSTTEPEPGVFVYDFGRQVVGLPELAVDGERGADVTVKAGERLEDDGTVYARSPYREAEIQEDTYVLRGDGAETWSPRFTYHGFRYVQVAGDGAPEDPDGAVTATEAHTPIERGDESGFAASNERFGRIHECCRRALLNNLHSVPTDTPVYEKRGWTGDALLTAEMAMYNFDPSRFETKRLRDLRTEVRLSRDDSVPAVVPSSDDADEDPNLDRDPVLGWQSEYPLLVWWMYRYYGDESALEEHYDELVAFVEYVRRQATDEVVVETGLGDWLPPGRDSPHPPEGPSIVGTTYYYESVSTLVDVAELLGKSADVERFEALADSIETAFTDRFFDPNRARYDTDDCDEYRQTSSVLALAFDLVPDEHEDAVVERLVADVVEERDYHLDTGVFGTKYLLQVLSERSYHDVATAVAGQRTHPSWGYMIENGATALWESWDDDSRSLNHHFLGTVDEWFYKYVAGIREPAAPGFRRVRIAPVVCDESVSHALEWAEARVDTISGTVASRWERLPAAESGGRPGLRLEATVPGNCTGRVELPTLGFDRVHVTVDGETVWRCDGRESDAPTGVTSVETADERIVCAVESGTYAFELRCVDGDGAD